jgi:hypothetical protein
MVLNQQILTYFEFAFLIISLIIIIIHFKKNKLNYFLKNIKAFKLKEIMLVLGIIAIIFIPINNLTREHDDLSIPVNACYGNVYDDLSSESMYSTNFSHTSIFHRILNSFCFLSINSLTIFLKLFAVLLLFFLYIYLEKLDIFYIGFMFFIPFYFLANSWNLVVVFCSLSLQGLLLCTIFEKSKFSKNIIFSFLFYFILTIHFYFVSYLKNEFILILIFWFFYLIMHKRYLVKILIFEVIYF